MKRCIVCGQELPEQELFVLDNAPASAQQIPGAKEVLADQGVTLELYQCNGCGLVQFACEPVAYYRDVIRAGGFSTTMTELRRRQYRHLIENWHLEGKRFFEAGCGRGEFLQVLTEFPVAAYGIEHKQELVTIAGKAGLQVWQDFPETAEQDLKGSYDVFLSFNFLEHQPYPNVMLQAIYHNLTEDGMGLVTVPALEYILEKGSYYELIRDHLAYYSFDTLRTLMERNGFRVLEEEMVNRDTIAVIVKKDPELLKRVQNCQAQQNQQNPQECQEQREPRTAVTDLDIRPLLEGYEIISREINQLLADYKKEGKRLAIWGASHQGFTLAGTLGLGNQVAYIIDSAPFKQGRFAPASHLPILAPEHFHQDPVDAILIVAPGYTEEIAGNIREKFGNDVQIFTLRSNHVERL